MIYVGTSGWQYDSWRGNFYPEKLPKRLWLDHYTTRFPVVEVNNTFYMLPKEQTFEKWHRETPAGFVIVVKASRYITHIRRLRDAKDSVQLFLSRATKLGEKLGPILFQLPPTLQADVELLRDFLAALPDTIRAAFEFRHATWDRQDVLEALDQHGAAIVLADRPGWTVSSLTTGGWGYVRFHQGQQYHPRYQRSRLEEWADAIAKMEARDVWIFFNNDPLGAAPLDARTMMDLLRERGCEVAEATAGRATGP